MLEGKVCYVFEHTLVINIGSKQGVLVNDLFNISDGDPITITDPETGEVLGECPRYTFQARVVQVEELYSLCTFDRYKFPLLGPVDFPSRGDTVTQINTRHELTGILKDKRNAW